MKQNTAELLTRLTLILVGTGIGVLMEKQKQRKHRTRLVLEGYRKGFDDGTTMALELTKEWLEDAIIQDENQNINKGEGSDE